MYILASKQVGEVSYMVQNLEILYNVIDAETILASKDKEKNPKTGKLENYVSLSRDLTSAGVRNPNRWRYGVVLDGTALSEHYHIEPISYVGSVVPAVNLKVLTKYDNGTCYAQFVNFGSTKVTPRVYHDLEQLIMNMSEEEKEQKRLVVQDGGTRKSRGAYIEKKYDFRVPRGGPRVNAKTLPESFTSLLKHSNLNETEERAWVGSKDRISIHGCIKGAIIPKSEVQRNDANDPDSMINLVTDIMDDTCGSGKWKLVTY